MSSSPQNPERRSVLGIILSVASALVVTPVAFVATRYLAPERAEKIPDTLSLDALELTEQYPSVLKLVGSLRVLVVRLGEKNYKAFNAKCTHLGCTVQFRKTKGDINCSCHGGTYDVNDGHVIAGPPPRALQQLSVSFDGKTITVKTGAAA